MIPRILAIITCLGAASCTTSFRVAQKKVRVTELSQLAGDYAPYSTENPDGNSASLANFLWPTSKSYHLVERVRFSVPRPGVLRCEGILPGGRKSLVREHVLGKDAVLKFGVLRWDLEESRKSGGIDPEIVTAAVLTNRSEFQLLENRDLCMRLHSGAYGIVMLIPIANNEVSEYGYRRLK